MDKKCHWHTVKTVPMAFFINNDFLTLKIKYGKRFFDKWLENEGQDVIVTCLPLPLKCLCVYDIFFLFYKNLYRKTLYQKCSFLRRIQRDTEKS